MIDIKRLNADIRTRFTDWQIMFREKVAVPLVVIGVKMDTEHVTVSATDEITDDQVVGLLEAAADEIRRRAVTWQNIIPHRGDN